MNQRILKVSLGLFLTALTTLMVEILLIHVFDVILMSNVGYVVVTIAMFAFGLAGLYSTIYPIPKDVDIRKRLAILSFLMAVSILLLQPGLNVIALVRERFTYEPLQLLMDLGMMCLMLMVPFFLGGLVFTYLFSAYTSRIRSLYFWDLLGAAVGCVIFLPFFRRIGPGGLMFCAAAILMLASALFVGRRNWLVCSALIALAVIAIPFLTSNHYFEFHLHQEKRGLLAETFNGRIELTEWDPISRIDVVNGPPPWFGKMAEQKIPPAKHVAYDGGSQSSIFFPFDGDYKRLRRILFEGKEPIDKHFGNHAVLVSHFLKRDTGAEVLIFGSAGGQEIKAALLFNANRVDGIELVETMVNLGKGAYAKYLGNIFNDPRVNNQVGEGRSYLRSTDKKYDIIQIFSNHTSSYVAAGIGANTPLYLQTVEAYREYFLHLKSDGVLHINHHFYPRMVTVAARAWKEMGRKNFQKHVVISERPGGDTLPTMLIKMSPWTLEEVNQLKEFLAMNSGEPNTARIVVDPLDHRRSFLSPDFFSGDFLGTLQSRMDYMVLPSTDDWPYFNNIQRSFTKVKEDPTRFLNADLAQSINGRLGWPLGEYTIIVIISAVGILFSVGLIFVPLLFSTTDQKYWSAKYISLGYFACLGTGFILIELVLIQIFMKLVGFPLYTFSVVIFTLLAAAALGSITANGFGISPEKHWMIPFIGVLANGMMLWWLYPRLFDIFLAAPTVERIGTAVVMIFPLAFFLGMPFPLGILSLQNEPKGAVAWAWGANAVFTVIGGTAAGVLSMLFGFRLTLLSAFVIYLLAFLLFSKLRLANCHPVLESDDR